MQTVSKRGMNGHDAFVTPNFCDNCRKHIYRCVCLCETLAERDKRLKAESRKFWTSYFKTKESTDD